MRATEGLPRSLALLIPVEACTLLSACAVSDQHSQAAATDQATLKRESFKQESLKQDSLKQEVSMNLTDKQQRNLDILKTMAANGIKGNWDVVRPYVDDNLEMVMPEGLPYGKTFHGWDGYREGLAALGFWTDLSFAPGEMIPTEDKVIYLSHLSGKIASNGKAVSQPYLAVWEIRDEKVVKITAYYFDTKQIADLAAE